MKQSTQPQRIFLIATAVALCCASFACTPASESGVKVIVGAKLIASPGAAPVEYSVIVIDGAKFRAVGPQQTTPVPKGAEMTRGIGMTAEPAPGGAIANGQPANLILTDGHEERIMRNGEWISKVDH